MLPKHTETLKYVDDNLNLSRKYSSGMCNFITIDLYHQTLNNEFKITKGGVIPFVENVDLTRSSVNIIKNRLIKNLENDIEVRGFDELFKIIVNNSIDNGIEVEDLIEYLKSVNNNDFYLI